MEGKYGQLMGDKGELIKFIVYIPLGPSPDKKDYNIFSNWFLSLLLA